MRSYAAPPPRCLTNAAPAAREQTRAVLQRLFHFFTRDKEAKVLQLRTNLVPISSGPLVGAAEFMPHGLYFDVDVAEIPHELPADLPQGLGELRWLMKDVQVRDFARKHEARKQPYSKYQVKMLQYFKVRGYADTGESVAAPRGRMPEPHNRPNNKRRLTNGEASQPADPDRPMVCNSWAAHGRCARGRKCKFQHPAPEPQSGRGASPSVIVEEQSADGAWTQVPRRPPQHGFPAVQCQVARPPGRQVARLIA